MGCAPSKQVTPPAPPALPLSAPPPLSAPLAPLVESLLSEFGSALDFPETRALQESISKKMEKLSGALSDAMCIWEEWQKAPPATPCPPLLTEKLAVAEAARAAINADNKMRLETYTRESRDAAAFAHMIAFLAPLTADKNAHK